MDSSLRHAISQVQSSCICSYTSQRDSLSKTSMWCVVNPYYYFSVLINRYRCITIPTSKPGLRRNGYRPTLVLMQHLPTETGRNGNVKTIRTVGMKKPMSPPMPLVSSDAAPVGCVAIAVNLQETLPVWPMNSLPRSLRFPIIANVQDEGKHYESCQIPVSNAATFVFTFLCFIGPIATEDILLRSSV